MRVFSRDVDSYESRPTPVQMTELVSIGMSLAKDQEMIRGSRQDSNAHIFLAKGLETLEFYNEEDHRYTLQRFTGRVARIGYRRWSLRIAESYWENDQNREDGYRATYKFEWTPVQVLQADKHVHVKNVDELYDPELPPMVALNEHDASDLRRQSQRLGAREYINRQITESEFLPLIHELERVSDADCQTLAQDMRQFSETSREILASNR